jgi:hypothetical protein
MRSFAHYIVPFWVKAPNTNSEIGTTCLARGRHSYANAAGQPMDTKFLACRFEALHTTGLTALVGREEELQLLLRRWSIAIGVGVWDFNRKPE